MAKFVKKYALPIGIIGSISGCSIILNMDFFPAMATGVLIPVVLLFVRHYASGGSYHGQEKISGKTVIITGANTGIGKETARDLARRGGKIIMACRDMEKCELAKKEIMQETGNLNIECHKLDLASFASIREFAKMINSKESRIDILINNAGVMMCPKMNTQDGLEMQIGVNHFGHFLLTYLLLDKIKASAPSRIITLSSKAHTRGVINFDDLNSEKSYNRLYAYGQSKLANVLFSRELSKSLQGTGVTSNSLHPGVVSTELYRYIPSILKRTVMYPFEALFFKNSVEGAQTTIRLAVDPALETVTGKYFRDCEVVQESRLARDDETAKKLWDLSLEVTKCRES